MNEIEKLLGAFNEIAEANNWQHKHTPKNLAMAIGVEAAELAEIFQWLSDGQTKLIDSTQRQQASDEIADVFLYLICLADKLNINIIEAAHSKMEDNKRRFLPS